MSSVLDKDVENILEQLVVSSNNDVNCLKLNSFDNSCCSKITTYINLLVKWNSVMNLVGPYSWENMIKLLLIDSFYLSIFLDKIITKNHVESWDLGAGAGLPGIPLRMTWLNGNYTMVEPRDKRAVFLTTAITACKLQQTFAFKGKAESFMPKHKKADVILSRAFLPFEKVLNLTYNYLQDDGVCVFLSNKLPVEPLEKWKIVAVDQYNVQGALRFFWAAKKN